MEEAETIEPEYLEIKKVHEIKVDNNKIRIEINNNEIIFGLIIDLSFNKYIKRFKFDEFRKKYGFPETKNKNQIYNDLIYYEYEINEKDKTVYFDCDKKIKFEEKIRLTNEEMIKELIYEIKNMYKEKNE